MVGAALLDIVAASKSYSRTLTQMQKGPERRVAPLCQLRPGGPTATGIWGNFGAKNKVQEFVLL